jgi:hypothetical protein
MKRDAFGEGLKMLDAYSLHDKNSFFMAAKCLARDFNCVQTLRSRCVCITEPHPTSSSSLIYSLYLLEHEQRWRDFTEIARERSLNTVMATTMKLATRHQLTFAELASRKAFWLDTAKQQNGAPCRPSTPHIG